MQRHVVGFVGIFVLPALILTVGCGRARRDFEEATRQNTEQAYRQFIQAHEKDPLAQEARTRLESLLYQDAMGASDEGPVSRFLAEFPGSEKAPEVRQRFEVIALEVARKQSSPAALEAFLVKYPATAQAEAVRKEIDSLVAQRFRLKPSDKINGSVNIDMEGNLSLRVPRIATLGFAEPCTLTILRKDGTVLATKDGVEARDDSGIVWQSQKVELDGKQVYAFFARR
jgi:hypothetical protein